MPGTRLFAADVGLCSQAAVGLFFPGWLDGLQQALWRFAAGAVELVLAVPFNPLFEGGLCGHFVLLVPEFVHGVPRARKT